MGLQEMIQSMQERLQTSGSVKNVYGEPIVAGGRTIVPVARIGYGFGAGRGGSEEEGGGGGGGGVGARPAGVFEISATGTRFIPAAAGRKLAMAAAAGFISGIVFAVMRRQ